MLVKVHNLDAQEIGEIELADEVFGLDARGVGGGDRRSNPLDNLLEIVRRPDDRLLVGQLADQL